MKNIIVISKILVVCLFLTACARNPVTGKKQVVLISEEKEIAMGKEADPQIIAQFGLYEDSALQRFLNTRGQEMAAISHRPNLQHTFRVLNSEVVNAFATPGGYIYFTRGIMAYFNSEADFEGVLGHEVGHIAYRHSVEQQRNMVLSQIGLIAGIIINPELARFADMASSGIQLLLLKNSRDAERESDELSVEYSTRLKYDAHETALFFKTLERLSSVNQSAELPEFLSTHPNPADRYTNVNKLADQWQKKLNLTAPVVNRNAYLQRIEGMVFGEDPKEGYREGNMFYHPVLKFQFSIPENWNYQNTPQRVQMAPKDGKALLMLTLAQGSSLQDAANNVTQQYKLTPVESRNVTVNGLAAYYLLADQRPEQEGGPTLRTMSYFIQYNGNIYHMIGVSSLAEFNNYAATFNNNMQAFRPLTDVARLNKKADRIRIRTVNTAQTLSQFLIKNNIAGAKLEQHAIMNGMQLTDNLPAGMKVKIIAE